MALQSIPPGQMKAVALVAAEVAYFYLLTRFLDENADGGFVLAVAWAFFPLVVIPGAIFSVLGESWSTPRGVAIAGASTAALVALMVGIVWIFVPSPSQAPAGPTDAQREAEWVLRGQKAVKAKLKDPDSAQFRKVIFHRGKSGIPVACGEVNSKNSLGGYGGFQGFLSAGSPDNTYLEEQLGSNEFAKLWNKLCAS